MSLSELSIRRPVFAVDVGISQRWWIQPFLKFVRTMALDPLKPFSLRAIINAVKDGNMLVIFPEGRITVTGSLMKVYDGAGMIADKSDAMVLPVRIDGLEYTQFSRVSRLKMSLSNARSFSLFWERALRVANRGSVTMSGRAPAR